MRNLFFIFFILYSYFFILSSHVSAASFYFQPPTITGKVGVPFQVELKANTGTDNLSGVDAYVSFDSKVLKANEATDGTFFPTVIKDIKTDTVYISGMFDDTSKSASGEGTIATITFEPIADGTATLSIDCANSKMVKTDINATNVLDCSQNATATVTVGAGATTTLTPAASPPTELPRTGIFENVIKIAIPGAIIMIVGTVVRLLL